ncbi:MAG: hypothetical protein KAU22_00815 [Desulfuromonadales bacterium]|nr:hypothetical protein [Desulfuromonadales bacterium]
MAKVPNLIIVAFLSLLVVGAATAANSELADPMRPVNYPVSAVAAVAKQSVATENWNLMAVLISAQRSVAVINGKSLQTGDVISGYKVVKIESDLVVLKNNQNKIVLRRAGTGLKKISANMDIAKGSNL